MQHTQFIFNCVPKEEFMIQIWSKVCNIITFVDEQAVLEATDTKQTGPSTSSVNSKLSTKPYILFVQNFDSILRGLKGLFKSRFSTLGD